MKLFPCLGPLVAFGAVCLLFGCDGENPFVTVIDPPGASVGSQYNVEANVYPGDSSRVFITLTSAESDTIDPRYQRAATVEVQLDDRPAVRFTEVEYTELNSFALERPVTVVCYSYRFRENELPAGTRVRLRVTLADGTALTSEATVPRAPSPDVSADFAWTREYLGNLRVAITIPDAAGRDYYLLRASARGYFSAPSSGGEPPTRPADSTEVDVSFYRERGLSYNYYGTRYLTDDRAFDGATNADLFRAEAALANDRRDSTLFRYAISTINPEGYAYLRAVQRAADQADNILVEPDIIETNIEGGLGALIVSSAAVRKGVVLEREF